MAVTVTPVGNPTVFGDKRVLVADFTFTGNYTDEGEALDASDCGYSQDIELVLLSGGVARAADNETSVAVDFDHSASKFVFFEGSTAGTALGEKTSAEAYPTNATVRGLVIGV